MHLGANIKSIRTKWKMSQEEFGDVFSIKKGSIHTYEKGDSEPRIGFILKLHELTGIPLYELCSHPISDDLIPDTPGKRINSEKIENPLKVDRTPMVDEPLYNYHNLIRRLKSLESDVEDLKRGQ